MTRDDDLVRAINEEISIVPYDESWPARYESERARLVDLAGDRILDIAHVGSTSVPGLAAKPIIDLIALVSSIAVADELTEHLCRNGYTTSAEFNATLGDKRWLMRQESGRRTHHLHLVLPDAAEWVEKIRFRDILRRDPIAARCYVTLKEELAERLGSDREAYTDAKGNFVRTVLSRG